MRGEGRLGDDYNKQSEPIQQREEEAVRNQKRMSKIKPTLLEINKSEQNGDISHLSPHESWLPKLVEQTGEGTNKCCYSILQSHIHEFQPKVSETNSLFMRLVQSFLTFWTSKLEGCYGQVVDAKCSLTMALMGYNSAVLGLEILTRLSMDYQR